MSNIKIKGTTYAMKIGAVFAGNYNETLDSCNVVIEAGINRLTLEPFEEVEIIDTSSRINGRNMCIDTYAENIVSFDPKSYEYVVTLFSKTKLLENIMLPNLSITKSKIVGERHSVWFYINKYMSYYGPKIKVKSGVGWYYDDKFTINNAVQTRFDAVECPEFQWSKPNLREVLTSLFGVLDLIPMISENTLTFYDLKQRGEQIDTSKINYIQTSKTSGDAVSALQLNLQNAMQSKKTDLRNTVKSIEYVSFRNESNHILTDDNIQIILKNPIYNIISIKACFTFYYSTDPETSNNVYYEFDMTDFVKEKSAYDVLKTTPLDTPWLQSPNVYQQLNVYYSRNNNIIDGWGAVFDGQALLFFPYTITPIVSIMKHLIYDYVKDIPGLYNWGYTINERDVCFKIEYETGADVACQVGKYLPAAINRVVSDNQSSSYVDCYAQGLAEFSKVNRLGNEMLTIYGEYDDEASSANLGDLYEDNIIFAKEITEYPDVILVKYTATKNYILQNYFTSVKAKSRSWQLAQKSESLTRHDIKKYYCEFSFSKKIDKILLSFDVANYFSTPFAFYNAAPLNTILATTFDANAVRYPILPASVDANGTAIETEETGFGYQLELDTKIVGNSIVLSYGYEDNIVVDRWIKNEDNFLYVVRNQHLYTYCDVNGENAGGYIYFMTDINPTDNAFAWPSNGDAPGTTLRGQMLACQNLKPLVRYANNEYKTMLLTDTRYKDNREIERMSLQFEFCADTPNIIVGSKFIELQKMINTAGNPHYLKVYASNDTYNVGDDVGHLDTLLSGGATLTGTALTSMKIKVDADVSTYNSWCITDYLGNLLIAVNGNSDTIYLNMLNCRADEDMNVYENNVAIGTIVGADENRYIAF